MMKQGSLTLVGFKTRILEDCCRVKETTVIIIDYVEMASPEHRAFSSIVLAGHYTVVLMETFVRFLLKKGSFSYLRVGVPHQKRGSASGNKARLLEIQDKFNITKAVPGFKNQNFKPQLYISLLKWCK